MRENININEYVDYANKKLGIQFQIKDKSESSLLKLVTPIVKVFNPRFESNYIQTFWSNMYANLNQFDKLAFGQQFTIVAHEIFHAVDWKRLNVLFGFLYLTPQVFAVLALIVVWFNWIVGLLILLFLLPIPSYARMLFELGAYRTGLVVIKEMGLPTKEHYIEGVIEQLAGKWYYFAWPFRSHLRNLLNDESALNDKQYDYVRDFIRENS